MDDLPVGQEAVDALLAGAVVLAVVLGLLEEPDDELLEDELLEDFESVL